jgi:hypothetical protein
VRHFTPQILASIACAIVLWSCAGDGPAILPTPTPDPNQTPGSGPTIDAVQTQIFNVSCLSSGCHNAADRRGDLVLEPGQSWSNLVGVVPEDLDAAQAGDLRVRAFDPETSFLVAKLEGPPPGQGARMPQGGPFLSESDVNLVREWILGGALDSQTDCHRSANALLHRDSHGDGDSFDQVLADDHGHSFGERRRYRATVVTPTVTATPSVTATIRVVTLAELQTTIFTPSCAIGFCHDTQGAPSSSNLNLEEGMSYANLVGVTPTNEPAAEAGLLRVEAFEPDNSFLVLKVCHPDLGEELCPVMLPREFGTPMPLLRPALSAEEVEAIRLWILRGAPETN